MVGEEVEVGGTVEGGEDSGGEVIAEAGGASPPGEIVFVFMHRVIIGTEEAF